MKNQKKIFIVLIIVIILAASFVPAVNYFVDPFGAFSRDNFWYSYSMTRNPRTAKISYIDSHNSYDSYVVGSSGASSLVVESLNKASGQKFYNAFFYGAYMPDIEKTVHYLIDKKEAKHILFPISFSFAEKVPRFSSKENILNIKASGENFFHYYVDFLLNDLRYSVEKVDRHKELSPFTNKYAVFLEESGNYDKRRRDIESITSLEEYLIKYPEFDNEVPEIELEKMDEFFDSLERVINYCKENEVKLDILMYPIYEKSLHAYKDDEIKQFYSKLTNLTSFWDFTATSISYDPRLFYDTKHYRNSVGDMMISKIYNQNDVYAPENFGTYVKKGSNYSLDIDSYSFDEKMQKKLKIFIMHSVKEKDAGSGSISPNKLEELLIYLDKNSYTTVGENEILDYVYKGKELPEKPVILTFDDGYYDNYELAFPILKKYKAKAIFFPIGVSIGKDAYRHTDIEINSHYGYDEIDDMLSTQLIDIGSHSYDLHRTADLENGEDNIRENMIKQKYETMETYVKDINLDFKYFRGKWKRYEKIPLRSFAYPLGMHDDYTDMMVKENGFEITFIADSGDNYLVKGFPQSLLGLKRTLIVEELDINDFFK